MKKLTLTFCAVAMVASASFAGTQMYSGKEMKQVAPAPCPSWYADNEWNVGISGVYAVNVNNDNNNNFFNNDSWDNGFGGAVDVKYFFRRYFGVGIQGFGLSVNGNDNNLNNRFRNNGSEFAGGVLGTFTFRYPIPCSRFAPYIWGGAGGYFRDNGNNNLQRGNNNNNDTNFMGQIGAGFEVRITPHIGWTNDVSYNFVASDNNNNNNRFNNNSSQDFVMIRTGLNFAF